MKIILVMVVALTGCAPAIVRQPVEVKIPVAVPCRAEMPKRPILATQHLTPNASRPEWLKAALTDREQLLAYTPRIEAILQGCVTPK